MATYFITGGTGLVGKRLIELIEKQGDVARAFSRKKSNNPNSFIWDVKNQTLEREAFDGIDYLVHLAGAGIADQRWNKARKQEIIDSRVDSTNLLFETIKSLEKKPIAIVSASAIGIYGTETKDIVFTEKDGPEQGYLAHVVNLWEKATNQFRDLNIPSTQLRIGVVLAKNGGALKEMTAPPVLAALGHGKQNIPWVHIDDLCRMILWSLQNKKNTVYNAVGPETINNQNFMKTISKYSSKILMPINAPAFVLKLMLGEMASLVLEGSPISCKKVIDDGFKFQFHSADDALKDVFG